MAADVGDLDAAFAIAGQAAALVGPVDLLINNASTLGPAPLRLLLDTDCEDLSRALAVNLVGPFRLTKAIAGSMVMRGRGTIVNISSDAAVEAYERWGAYGASKAALDHLTRIWAAELAGTGVRVLAIDPGEMNTAHARAGDARRRSGDAGRSGARRRADRRLAGGRAAGAVGDARGRPRRRRRAAGRRRRDAGADLSGAARRRAPAGGRPGGRRRSPRRAPRRCRRCCAPGDLLVVNDAATLPASLRGQDAQGRAVEVRLLSVADDDRRRRAALLGGAAGRGRLAPAHRGSPAAAAAARPAIGCASDRSAARSSRARRCRRAWSRSASTSTGDALWAALYREARPVQYSYLAHELPLWAVQTVYAGRPWAFEMPSAGRPLSWETLLALRRRGVRWAALTHAAGLSATGDPAIDAALPLPERYEIPAATVAAIEETRRGGGRVIAVGTTVVRALEGAAAATACCGAGSGTTDLRIGPRFRPRIVDGILSGHARRGREPLRAAGRVRERRAAAGRVGLRRGARVPDARARRFDADHARCARGSARPTGSHIAAR